MLDFHELEEPTPFTVAEQEAIDDLKLMCQEHLHIDFQTDDYFLTKFLRYCDWSVQAAYEAIVKSYEMRVNNSQHVKTTFFVEIIKISMNQFLYLQSQHNHPTVFASRNLVDYTHLLSLHSRIVLDKRDKNGRVVFIGKLGKVSSMAVFLSHDLFTIEIEVRV